MNHLTLLFFFFLPFLCNAQLEVFARGNLSTLPSSSQRVVVDSSPTPLTGFSSISGRSYTIEEDYRPRFGWSFGALYSKSFGERVSGFAGVSLSGVSFKRSSEVIYDDADLESPFWGEIITVDGQPLLGGSIGQLQEMEIGQTENVGETNLIYLDLPVGIEYKVLKKIGISVGLQFSYLLHASEVVNKYVSNFSLSEFSDAERDPLLMIPIDSFFELVEEKDKSQDGFNRFNLSANLRFHYEFIKNLRVNAGVSQGISSVYADEKEYTGNVYSRVISTGLSFIF